MLKRGGPGSPWVSGNIRWQLRSEQRNAGEKPDRARARLWSRCHRARDRVDCRCRLSQALAAVVDWRSELRALHGTADAAALRSKRQGRPHGPAEMVRCQAVAPGDGG